MKTSFFFLLTFGFMQLIHAEDPIVDWKIAVSDEKVKPGDVIDLIFYTDIPDGFHIYSNDFADCPPTKAAFNFTSHSSYELIGAPVPVGSYKYIDEIFECEVSEFEGHAKFIQKVKILEPNPWITGVLQYQVCTPEGRCILFDCVFSFEGQFRSSGKRKFKQKEPPVPEADVEPEKLAGILPDKPGLI